MSASLASNVNAIKYYSTKAVSILEELECSDLVSVRFHDDGREMVVDVKCLYDKPYQENAIPLDFWKSKNDT